MAADLDGQMAPVRVEDVKRVVVHIRHRLLSFDVVFRADIPHRRLSPSVMEARLQGSTPASNCPAGATFLQPGLRKSVGTYYLTIGLTPLSILEIVPACSGRM